MILSKALPLLSRQPKGILLLLKTSPSLDDSYPPRISH